MSEIEEGSLVEVIEDYRDQGFDGVKAVGTRFTVDYVISAEESEDGIAFVNGSGDGGWGNIDAPVSALKVVLSREEMEKTSPTPSLRELIELIQSNIHEAFGPLTIDETYASVVDKERGILKFSGEDEYGFRYNATLRITELWAD